mmetsp:Transcript_3332/g.20795  ORF Transcript_3332/g.20795 Transcript_3332/m.20795 type:complete len:201 (-) Transcript_3332:1208-1810(-)
MDSNPVPLWESASATPGCPKLSHGHPSTSPGASALHEQHGSPSSSPFVRPSPSESIRHNASVHRNPAFFKSSPNAFNGMLPPLQLRCPTPGHTQRAVSSCSEGAHPSASSGQGTRHPLGNCSRRLGKERTWTAMDTHAIHMDARRHGMFANALACTSKQRWACVCTRFAAPDGFIPLNSAPIGVPEGPFVPLQTTINRRE